MTDIPHHRRSPLDHGRDAPDLSDEALDAIRAEIMTWTDADGIEWVMAADYAALRAQLAREREAGDKMATFIAGTCAGDYARQLRQYDALVAALVAFRAAREGGG